MWEFQWPPSLQILAALLGTPAVVATGVIYSHYKIGAQIRELQEIWAIALVQKKKLHCVSSQFPKFMPLQHRLHIGNRATLIPAMDPVLPLDLRLRRQPEPTL
jgi:hypothetical protein